MIQKFNLNQKLNSQFDPKNLFDLKIQFDPIIQFDPKIQFNQKIQFAKKFNLIQFNLIHKFNFKKLLKNNQIFFDIFRTKRMAKIKRQRMNSTTSKNNWHM